MDRRTFVASAGVSFVALLGGCQSVNVDAATAGIPQSKLDRLAITGSVYRANFDGWQYADPTVMPRLTLAEYPAFIRDRFGVRNLELWSRQIDLIGNTDEDYRTVRAATDAAGTKVINLQVEGTPSMDVATAAERDAVVVAMSGWMDRARILGAGAARFNVTREARVANMDSVVEILRRAADYGQSIGVRVLVENHGGYTASIPDMIALVRAVNHDYCMVTIDWGDWNPPGDRYEAIQSAMPYVHIVSAKGYEFDPVTYEHTTYDVARLVRNAEAGGFRGIYSIDFFGPNPPKDTDQAMRLFIRTITDNLA